MNWHSSSMIGIKGIIGSWFIGLIIFIIELVFLPFRFLRLPGEWFDNFGFEIIQRGILVDLPPGGLGARGLVFLTISLIGLGSLVLLAAVVARFHGAEWKRALFASFIAILLGYFLFLNLYFWLFDLVNWFSWFSDLRYSPIFIFNLHFAMVTVILGQKGFIQRKGWVIPAVGYLFTFGVAMIIQQAIPGTGAGPYLRNFLQSPLAWMNVNFFFQSGFSKHSSGLESTLPNQTTARSTAGLLLAVNALATLIAILFANID